MHACMRTRTCEGILECVKERECVWVSEWVSEKGSAECMDVHK